MRIRAILHISKRILMSRQPVVATMQTQNLQYGQCKVNILHKILQL